MGLESQRASADQSAKYSVAFKTFFVGLALFLGPLIVLIILWLIGFVFGVGGPLIMLLIVLGTIVIFFIGLPLSVVGGILVLIERSQNKKLN